MSLQPDESQINDAPMRRLMIQETDLGHTVYLNDEIIGWVRAAESNESWEVPGAYWVIERAKSADFIGQGFESPGEAAEALAAHKIERVS